MNGRSARTRYLSEPSIPPTPGEHGAFILRGLRELGIELLPDLQSSAALLKRDPHLFEAASHPEIIRLARDLQASTPSRPSLELYLEQLMQALSRQHHSPAVQALTSAIERFEMQRKLPHPLGIGVVAIHLYAQPSE